MIQTSIDIAHVWQEFRIRCLELAVKVGATDETVIDIADKLGEYILIKSKRELANELSRRANEDGTMKVELSKSAPKETT